MTVFWEYSLYLQKILECLKELKHNLQRRLRVVKFEFIQQWLKILANVLFFAMIVVNLFYFDRNLPHGGVDWGFHEFL